MRMQAGSLTVMCIVLAMAGGLIAAEEKAQPTPEKPKAAEEKKDEADKPAELVHVWADRISYLRPRNLALVAGKATIIKGDFRIDCDNVEATLDPQSSRFKRIAATGNVRMYTVVPIPETTTERPPLQLAPQGRRAICDKADYDLGTEVVVLFGSPDKQPILWIGKDQVQADRVTYKRNESFIEFEGKVKLSAMAPKQQQKPPDTPAPAPK